MRWRRPAGQFVTEDRNIGGSVTEGFEGGHLDVIAGGQSMPSIGMFDTDNRILDCCELMEARVPSGNLCSALKTVEALRNGTSCSTASPVSVVSVRMKELAKAIVVPVFPPYCYSCNTAPQCTAPASLKQGLLFSLQLLSADLEKDIDFHESRIGQCNL